MTWKKFIYLYESDIVLPGVNFCLNDVKVEVFTGERAITVVSDIQSVVLLGNQTTLAQSTERKTSDSHANILLTARTKEPNIIEARKICTEALDEVVTLLGNLYHPAIFNKRLHAGWDATDASVVISEAIVFVSDRVYEIEQSDVIDSYDRLKGIAEKYNKMARLYASAASMPMCEDKFVRLWTILEIYPLNTKPGEDLELAKLYELLKSVTGISQNQINKKLKVHNEIYERCRCEIVHTALPDSTKLS